MRVPEIASNCWWLFRPFFGLIITVLRNSENWFWYIYNYHSQNHEKYWESRPETHSSLLVMKTADSFRFWNNQNWRFFSSDFFPWSRNFKLRAEGVIIKLKYPLNTGWNPGLWANFVTITWLHNEMPFMPLLGSKLEEVMK